MKEETPEPMKYVMAQTWLNTQPQATRNEAYVAGIDKMKLMVVDYFKRNLHTLPNLDVHISIIEKWLDTPSGR